MAKTAPLTDEQVEQLLNALLDFRDALINLTDRFHQRLAIVEQDMSLRRQAPMPRASEGTPLAKTLDRGNRPEMALLEAEASFGGLNEALELPAEPPAEITYDLSEGEDFSLLDFDDDDDDF